MSYCFIQYPLHPLDGFDYLKRVFLQSFIKADLR